MVILPFFILQAYRVWINEAICQGVSKTLKPTVFIIAYIVSPYKNVKAGALVVLFTDVLPTLRILPGTQ